MRKELSAIVRGISPVDEETSFIGAKSANETHYFVERDRLVTLKALQNAVHPVLEKYLNPKNCHSVLEVGCGTGFFSRWLAPQWLQGQLVSLEINPAALKEASKLFPNGNLLWASVYRLPVGNEKLDAIIGLSSFDSLLFLTKALKEAHRSLKPGGKIILFQDLSTELYYENGEDKSSIGANFASIERYHKDLITDLEERNFHILEGNENCLEAIAVESVEDIESRVDADIPRRNYPIFVGCDRGYSFPVLSKTNMKESGYKKSDIEEWLDTTSLNKIEETFRPQLSFVEQEAGAGEVIEWVRIRYLVAESI